MRVRRLTSSLIARFISRRRSTGHIVVGEQFGHALNGGQRRAHFVADQRDHVVLGLLQFVLACDVAQRSDDAEDRADAVLVGGDGGEPQRVVRAL